MTDPTTPKGRELLRRLSLSDTGRRMLDALDAKDAEIEQLKKEKANLLIANQRLSLPHPARDLVGEHKQLIAAKDAEIERIRTAWDSDMRKLSKRDERTSLLRAEIERLAAKLAALRAGIAEVVVTGVYVDEGHFLLDTDLPISGPSPAGEKLARLYKASDPDLATPPQP